MTPDVKFLTPSQVKALCQDLQIRPTKQLGQNFVMDPSTVQKIVQAAQIEETGTHVLEVGPGLGSLTLGLLAVGARVTCVELDKRLAYYLPQTLTNLAGDVETNPWQVLTQDALTLRADQVDNPEYLVSNLPYNVAVPVILHCLETFPSIKKVLVMVQKEVALRLSATPGNKLYGVPSVKAAWYGKSYLAGDISRNVFYPIPNVDSALVAIEVENKFDPAYREDTFAVIDAAFHNRRKMLRSVLKKWAEPANLEEILTRTGISSTVRGETLQVEDFYNLAKTRRALLAKTDLADNQENPQSATAQAPGKINLCLYLTGQAENGKHHLETVFQGVDIYSTVTITRLAKEDTASEVELNVEFAPPVQAYNYCPDRDRQALADLPPADNLAVKAWKLFANCCAISDPVQIKVTKEIPVAAGMAGGSADAAATLLAANKLYANPLSAQKLQELAAELGADVPFGLLGGLVKGIGFGDKVESLSSPGESSRYFVAVVSPQVLSTAKVFQTWHDLNLPYSKTGILDQTKIQHYQQSTVDNLELHNDLEPASIKLLPELKKLKEKCLELGALQVIVSGSGPTLACLCADEAHQIALAKSLAEQENVAYTLCVKSQRNGNIN